MWTLESGIRVPCSHTTSLSTVEKGCSPLRKMKMMHNSCSSIRKSNVISNFTSVLLYVHAAYVAAPFISLMFFHWFRRLPSDTSSFKHFTCRCSSPHQTASTPSTVRPAAFWGQQLHGQPERAGEGKTGCYWHICTCMFIYVHIYVHLSLCLKWLWQELGVRIKLEKIKTMGSCILRFLEN